MGEKILVAMSGGVDSSVAALRLQQQGYEIEGAYMKNWINEDEILGECPWQQDIEDASAVSDKLGIPFRVVNLMEDYRSRIVNYLLAGYKSGTTPNPDVMCNREIKFGVFLDYAVNHGFDTVATGHYARLKRSTDDPVLIEGIDKNKDQTYFLAMMRREQVQRAHFSIGDLTKPELRDAARKVGLPNAEKKDSQGICFIGNIKMQDFLKEYVLDDPGPILKVEDHTVLGEHKGLHYFTIGQRKGIGVPSNCDHQNYVVVGKDPIRKALLVAFESPDAPGLYAKSCQITDMSFFADPISQETSIEVKTRYRDARIPAICKPTGKGFAEINFETPQRALALGQVMAIYDGERLLGGGIYSRIDSAVAIEAR